MERGESLSRGCQSASALRKIHWKAFIVEDWQGWTLSFGRGITWTRHYSGRRRPEPKYHQVGRVHGKIPMAYQTCNDFPNISPP